MPVPETNGEFFREPFKSLVWFGNHDKGFLWFCGSERNWSPQDQAQRPSALTASATDKEVTFKTVPVSAPYSIQSPVTYTFGFFATPVRPMPEGWRGWSDGFGFKGTRIARCLISPPYWGSYISYLGRYPAFEDFTYIKKIVETKNTGVIDQEFVKLWIERLGKATLSETPWLKSAGQAFAVNHTNAAFGIAKSLYPVRNNAVIYPYTCNYDSAAKLPEFMVFQDEWSKPQAHVFKSFSDYAIYYLNEMLECVLNGVYNDNTFFAANFNWVTGNAYIDDQGTVRPSLGLWRSRDYHKRQLTLMVERGLNPWITVHNTNANILPTLSFATNSMGMEWKYGSQDFQERFTPDYIRAVNQGRQGGFFPTVLDGIIEKDSAKRTWATRTMLAALLPHEVRPTAPRQCDALLYQKIHDLMYQFGIAEPDCQFYAYWNTESPVITNDSKLLVSAYQRGKKMLLVCGSYTGNITARITINRGILKSVKNLETGTVLEIEKNMIVFSMNKHDFALLEAELD
jgi:hypothetical protein